MAKSSKKELQAKKRREKRREAFKVAPSYPWDSLDVSAWFDTSFLIDGETGQCCDSCLSERGWYEKMPPAEFNLTWWAAAHPEEEKEAHAASLAAALGLARTKKKNSAAEEAHYAGLLEPTLKELKELAAQNVVTANAVLGAWYDTGCNVRKNRREAKKHLLKAADMGDPYSAFLLDHDGYCPEKADELYRQSRECGCPSAFVVQGMACRDGRVLPEDELEDMAAHLAAFAVKKSSPCLCLLVQILRKQAGESLRAAYAKPMLDLLRQAADAGIAEALCTSAEVLRTGTLCSQDMGKAKELYHEAMQQGSTAAGVFYARCLLDEAEELPEPQSSAKKQEACALLRENVRENRRTEESRAVLGMHLISSDDDKEFMEGMACLKKSLSFDDYLLATDCVEKIVVEQTSPKRRALALKLLDSIAAAGCGYALFVKGLYCLAGMYGEAGREEGIELMQKAGQKGKKDAWGIAAGVCLFGCCGIRANTKKALLMAIEGDERDNKDSRLWRLLIELGEFSRPAKSLEGLVRDPKKAAWEMDVLLNSKKGGPFLILMDRLVWLGAAQVCSTASLHHTAKKPHPVQKFDELMDDAVMLARLCVEALKHAMASYAAFYAYALKRLSRTVYGRFYVGALAAWLDLPFGSSLSAVLKVLQDYQKELPESFYRWKNWEDPGLKARLAAWRREMTAIKSQICR